MFMSAPKQDLVEVGIEEHKPLVNNDNVSQNIPNPFSSSSVVNVILKESSISELEVTHRTGKRYLKPDVSEANPGLNTLIVEAGNLTPGIYFYTVKAGESSVTKR